MKKPSKILAALTAAALLLPSLPVPEAKAAEAVTGSIAATLRIDYAQALSQLSSRNVQLELRRGNSPLGDPIDLTREGSLTLAGYPVEVSARNTDGGELGGGQWPGYLDVTISGLPQGEYTLSFTGRGYAPFTQKVSLSDYSKHVTLGTGDATFTLGDVNDDGKVDEKDRAALSAALSSTKTEDLRRYDLNGDGTIDIVDLAYVNRLTTTSEGAQVRDTVLLTAPVTAQAIEAALTESGTTVRDGQLADLFDGSDSAVTLASGGSGIVLPLPLSKTVEMEEVVITTPAGENAVLAGTVTVEDEEGQLLNIPFDHTAPQGVRAIGPMEGKGVISVELGRRVPVKKVTITVTKTESGGYAAIESIQFLKDIVPDVPAAPDSVVKRLSAEAGSEQVSLQWSPLPNVSGYKVLYWPLNNSQETRELHVDVTTALVTGLENLETYSFTVTPTDGSWEGKPSQAVTATPQPAKVPDKTDMVRVTAMEGALGVSWKEGKSATWYEVYYQEKDEGAWRQAGTRLTQTSATISGLENDVTYYIYVVAGNDIGKGPRSDIAEGTPKAIKYERPEGIPAQGILSNDKIASIRLADSGNHASGAFDPQWMADDDYRTAWTAQNWWRNEHVIVTFTQPVDLSAVLWVPRLDGGYPSNLRAYSVQVWYEGEDLTKTGHLVVPDPARGGVDNGGTGRDVDTWPAVRGTPATTNFAILPFGPSANVRQISVAVEQRAYTTISLSEILFMEYDPAHCLPDEIAGLFSDGLCTALAAGVTQEKIDGLRARLNSDESDYYLDLNTLADELALAQELLDGKGTSGVVVSGLSARGTGADSKYQQGGSELQALGLTAGAGQEITVYAQGIPAGQTVTLYATQFNAEASAWRAEIGKLQNGRNVFTVPKVGSRASSSGGSLYVSYAGTEGEDIRLHVRRAIDIPMLELANWYDLTETGRRAVIGAYVDELAAYLGRTSMGSPTTDYRNTTEISTPVVLLSLPALPVQSALGAGTREEKITTLYNAVLAWEDIMAICKQTQGIDNVYADNDMEARQNIRCMTMFAGAFMYAAGNHIGIGYGSCGGMVTGQPISLLPEGATANRLFGWGIAHEIGHNMDKLGKAEITNNIYSILVQTWDGNAATFPSRLEKSNKYRGIFTKVAQGYPGASNDVFVQLGLYWQLHLAYDDADPLAFYNSFFKAWKAGTYTAGAAGYDDRLALTAAGVTGKDLTEFFTRWGMDLSQPTRDKLAQYEDESRAIWYLNDQSRRDRLAGVSAAAGSLTAEARKAGDREITITLDASGITGNIQGFEIRRNGKSIAFVTEETYTDIIGSANHRTYHYEVAAYDSLGNLIAAADAGEVRVAYDKTVDPSEYDITRSADGTVVITMKEETIISGLKLSGTLPTEGALTVTVTDVEGKSVTARSTTFDPANNQAVDDKDSFVTYFQMPGAEESDTRIWTYDAGTVTIAGIPAQLSTDSIGLISYAGDDVAFLEDGTMGLLAQDYTYDTMEGTETIPAGTLVILGTYRGDPVYNTLMVEGRFTGVTTGEDGSLEEAPVTERPVDGYALLFAEVPATGPVSDISDGFFLFVPNVQREAELQGTASDCDTTNLLPSQIRLALYRTDDPADPSSKRLTAQTLWIYSPGGTTEELPVVELHQGGGR